MLALPFAFPFGAAGEDWKKSGDEDGTFWRAAWGVPCTDAGRDRRGAGEDMFGRWLLVKDCGGQGYPRGKSFDAWTRLDA